MKIQMKVSGKNIKEGLELLKKHMDPSSWAYKDFMADAGTFKLKLNTTSYEFPDFFKWATADKWGDVYLWSDKPTEKNSFWGRNSLNNEQFFLGKIVADADTLMKFAPFALIELKNGTHLLKELEVASEKAGL